MWSTQKVAPLQNVEYSKVTLLLKTVSEGCMGLCSLHNGALIVQLSKVTPF